MNAFLPFVVVGLVTGSLYGLTGMGLVLTYKTSGIFNFAHGAVATVAAYAFYSLRDQAHVPWPVAFVVCVLGLGIAMGTALERLARELASVSPALQVVATVGILIAVQGVVGALYGTQLRSLSTYLPTRNFGVLGVNVGLDQMIVFLIALLAAVGLYGFFRWTTLGLSVQAVVDDPALLALGGTNPVRVRRTAWAIGACFAALSGVLLVPTVGLDATILTLLVVQAFGAAAVGLFSSLPMTYAGGLLIGVLSALSTKYTGSVRWLGGLPSAIPFLTLFLVLVVVPRRKLVDLGGQLRMVARTPPAVSARVRGIGGLLALAGAVLVPFVVGARLPVFTNAAIFVTIFLSLHLLVRTSGQVSLAHASFAAVGAATFSHLSSQAHLPWLLAVLGAGLLTIPVGVVVAVPAIRLSGLYLAVATFGFGILIERLIYPTALLFGSAGALPAPRPALFGLDSDRGYYFAVLGVTIAMVALASVVIRGRLGRLLRALSDSPVALSTLGTGVNSIRVLVFGIASFMAGVAGALFSGLTQSVNGHGFSFFSSLMWLTILVISGAPFRYAPLPTAIVGGINIAVIPAYLQNQTLLVLLPALFGIAAVVNALVSDRDRGRAKPISDPVGDRVVGPGVVTSRRRTSTRPGPVAARSAALASPKAALR